MPDFTDNAVPDASPILEMIDGMRLSKAVFAALELGVFDYLAAKADTCAGVAEALSLKSDALERLLDTCVSVGLLRKQDGVYQTTPLSDTYLVRSSPRSVAGYMLYANRISWRLWEHLEDGLAEGTPRWNQTFGNQADIFSHFFRTEEQKRTFLAGMHGMGQLSSPQVAAAFDLSKHLVVADLGGGTGHLALSICERYPTMRGIVFDLETVTPVTREYLSRAGALDRITVMSGDFFLEALPSADLYCLGRIFHDWSEDRIRQLLRKMHAALPEGGAVLLAEMLLSADKTYPTTALLQSLNMLMCTDGRERSLDEYRALFESEGFTAVQGVITGSVLDAIYAIKSSM